MQNIATLAVLGFAAYRATHLVVWDSIVQPVRDRIEAWHADKFTSRFRTFIRNLIKCPYCVGWWLSMITALTYLTAAGQWGRASIWVHAVECWAVAGIQALLNRWDDTRNSHDTEES